MTAQLIITMRGPFARRFAEDRSILNMSALLRSLASVRLIGSPGFSMRVSVDEAEVPALQKILATNFIVEPDYAMKLQNGGRGRRSAAAPGR
jgi:hypothetical protein